MSTTAATSRPSPAWGPAARISTTPAGLPPSTPPSAGQITASFFASGAFSSRAFDESSSGGYFDLVAANAAPSPSNAAQFFQASRDRDFSFNMPSSAGGSAGASASASANVTPKFTVARKNADMLERKFVGRHAGRTDERGADLPASPLHGGPKKLGLDLSPRLHQRVHYKPVNPALSEGNSQMSSGASTPTGPLSETARHAHHSSAPMADQSRLLTPEQPFVLHRAQSTPVGANVDMGDVKMISAERCLEILKSSRNETLLLDVRPLLQFTRSHITGSLNLCIPTTLLKRPSFNLQKVEDTFGNGQEKSNFNKWRTSTRIIVYDLSTTHAKDAALLMNLLKKFTREGWTGEPLILAGGFSRFAADFPGWIERSQQPATSSSASSSTYGKSPLSISLTLPTTAPSVVGGCAMPTPSSNSVTPFFSNIRQNVDLVGGVGQLPVNLPPSMDESTKSSLPSWLARVADSADGGRTAALQFLNIEVSEQSRMQQALSNPSTSIHLGQGPTKRPVKIAGIEKGSKNRYNNIYPYDHSRVKLQDTTESACDYINASFVRSSRSNKRYIATQAPMPSTFNDFWRVVWEQGIRLIVMLTAETDGAQVKCHYYWNSADYGNLKVQLVSEGTIPLDPSGMLQSTEESPFFNIRHFSITNSKAPFEPPREVTQIQYTDWPDFGAPAKPYHLLRLIEECDSIVKPSSSRSAAQVGRPDPAGQRKVIVHCSAGCGRTGTFCTVDSVIDMLKRQRKAAQNPVRTEPGWVYEDNTDLVAATVEDFRSQRLSMVQNLRQFVLCYESVLEWLASGAEM
ncbi:protein-tyrosine-phosphatase [Arthroderma uncinatum]|uniref:protein-tyrosine-phosphatase n=1 Tax=Arthroderma uncinatum TaxID=74035 RepID=UPI00144A64A6|nr:protein-tyrosine-phosphatase [Arthroderma uncinatum]KAF3481018.1 protein-tyrosine-phosphatase [Arthroderma uncinatum]